MLLRARADDGTRGARGGVRGAPRWTAPLLGLAALTAACGRPDPPALPAARPADSARRERAAPDPPPAPAAVESPQAPPAEDGAMAAPPPAPPESARRHASGLPLHGWKRLELVADGGLLLAGTVVLRRRAGTYTPPEGGEARPATLVESHTEARALAFIDLEVQSTSEVDAASGETREYLEVTPGKKAKLLRVQGGELRLVRFRPPRGSGEEPLARWERHGQERWALPTVGGRTAVLYDYYALIAHMERLPLVAAGDRAAVWMASTDGPIEIEIRVAEERRRERVVTDLERGRERRVELRELRLALAALGGEGENVRGFLDMEGETELWVEAESRALVEVRGRVPGAGMVSVELRGIR